MSDTSEQSTDNTKHALSAIGAVELKQLIGGLDQLETLFKLPTNGTEGDVQLGPLRVRRRLGSGRYGVVFLADDSEMGRRVAVKVPQPSVLTDPLQRDRFSREARAAARLDHPGIVPVFRTGTDRGLIYLVAGYVDGPSLAAWLAQRPTLLPTDTAARLVELIARAVHHAHERGVLHCDLKPANILIDRGSAEAAVSGIGTPRVTDFGMARLLEDDPALTASILIAGTPFYMSPEQVRGDRRNLTARTDLYAIGVILYELLCGRVPFRGDSLVEISPDVLRREPPAPRSLVPSVPRDLETICLKCLAKEPGRRYATGGELADDLRAYLDGRPISARPVGVVERAGMWVRRNPVVAALTAGLLFLLVGGAVAANQIRQERALEAKVARVHSLVEALATADSSEVPQLIAALTENRAIASPRLRELASQPVNTKPGLHARLALLDDEPGVAPELAQYLTDCRLDELLLLRQFLRPHTPAVAAELWRVLADARVKATSRVRAACALALMTPNDPRWPEVSPALAEAMVRATPGEFVVWSQALAPVGGGLIPSLLKTYPEIRARIASGRLHVSELAAEVSAFEITTGLLALYVADRPPELAQIAMLVDARHHKLFSEALQKHKLVVVPILKAELQQKLSPEWVKDGELLPNAVAALGPAASAHLLGFEATAAAFSQRHANAAAILFLLGEAESVWPVFAFPKDGDPTLRSLLLERLREVGADPARLLERYSAEKNLSAKRAILLALGDYPPSMLPAGSEEPFVSTLLQQYREHPDPGLHAAIGWVLRHRWGKAPEVAAIDAELSAETRLRSNVAWLGSVGSAAAQHVLSGLVPAGKDWFVNGENQTYAVIRGPVEFTMGSPLSQKGVMTTEASHRKRISRTFAIATKEVTTEEFLRCAPKHIWERTVNPLPDTPAGGLTWYQAVAYCNWLSEREGIPRDQWCYIPNKDGAYAEGMKIKPGHLRLTGYRLPTEAEWEYACRAGSVTPWSFGWAELLLERYGWSTEVSDNRARTVGLLRPNDLGLFDAMGNAVEWCENLGTPYDPTQTDDVETPGEETVGEQSDRVVRGGAFMYQRRYVRSGFRLFLRPGYSFFAVGIRPTRTIFAP